MREPTEAEWLALCSEDLAAYTSLMFPKFRLAPHHRRIVEALEDVEAGRCKRLMIFVPPRHGKSLLASQHFPAWCLGRNPARYIIAMTYGQELADDFGRSVRNQIVDPLFQAVFPGVGLRTDSAAASRFNTPQGGAYFAAGRDASITGRGAHLLLIDDPIKNREEADSEGTRRKIRAVYESVAYTRLMPDGAIVIIQTRWHEDDLSGWLLREHAHENWRVIDLPAIDPAGGALWPEAYPLDALQRIRRALSAREWSALYQQRPYSDEGAILKRGWWRPWMADATAAEATDILAQNPRATIEALPKTPDFIIVSLDTAYTAKEENDATGCTVWYVVAEPAPHGRVVMDMTKPDSSMGRRDAEWMSFRSAILLRYGWAKRLGFPELVAEIEDTCKHFGRPGVPMRVLVEAKASGLSVIQELRRRHPSMSIHAVNPRGPGGGDKVARAHAVSSLLEGGNVYALAKWEGGKIVFRDPAQRVIDECAAFPLGVHDDLTDSVTQALRHMRDQGLEFFQADEPAAPPMTADEALY